MYQIISDSSCDLSNEYAQTHQVHVIPFYVSFDGEHYQKEIEEMPVRDMYQLMVDHPEQFPKTSMPPVSDYSSVFSHYAAQGIDIVCICITSKFSGSYHCASIAKEEVQQQYPQAQIAVIDATFNTVLQGLFVKQAVAMRDAGIQFAELVHKLESIKSSGRIFFTIETISYLLKGGRAGKVAGKIAGMLGLRPLIVLKEGEIFLDGIARGRDISLKKVMDNIQKHFRDSGENADDYDWVIGYGYDKSEAERFRDRLLQNIQSYCHLSHIDLEQIGAAIAVHTGPYPLGVGILKKWQTLVDKA